MNCFTEVFFILFVVSGEIIDLRLARIREREYAKDDNIGSFMYFFKYQNKQYCVDATDETPYKGRLINHSVIKPNLKTKVCSIKSYAIKSYILSH